MLRQIAEIGFWWKETYDVVDFFPERKAFKKKQIVGTFYDPFAQLLAFASCCT